MVKRKSSKRKKKEEAFDFIRFFWGIILVVIFILKIPFYVIKFFVKIVNWIRTKIKKEKVKEKREAMSPVYDKFNLVKTLLGDLGEWEEHVKKSDSTIGIILGARGSGKSALAIRMFENLCSKARVNLYAMGFREDEMPSWIHVVDSVEKIKNNSHILIDEGGILFNSRESMSAPNKLLSELMLIARHKNLSILFISQNSSNLEVNILRQADYLILKPSSLLQKSFERKIVKEIYTETQKGFSENKKDKGLAYVHSDKFTGFVSNSLPSFWNISISKSWNKK